MIVIHEKPKHVIKMYQTKLGGARASPYLFPYFWGVALFFVIIIMMVIIYYAIIKGKLLFARRCIILHT